MTNVVKKVDYKKCSDKWGVVYDQTITISFDLAYDFNNYVWELKESVEKKDTLSSDDLKILDYLEVINYYTDTYTTLTTLRTFIKWYKDYVYTPPKRDVFLERILDRNTRFVVVPRRRV